MMHPRAAPAAKRVRSDTGASSSGEEGGEDLRAEHDEVRSDTGASSSGEEGGEDLRAEHDEDGQAEPYVKPSKEGAGKGLFTRGKPRPIEYKRDTGRPNGGFLSAAEADALWESQTELSAQYLMEVGLDTQWYRDEVTGGGALRPITEISRYIGFGQKLDWDEKEAAMVLQERGDRSIYVPILDSDLNPAAFANDACFGRHDPADEPDEYDTLDMAQNALEQVPCLTRNDGDDGDGKLYFSSVWLYPRSGWN